MVHSGDCINIWALPDFICAPFFQLFAKFTREEKCDKGKVGLVDQQHGNFVQDFAKSKCE